MRKARKDPTTDTSASRTRQVASGSPRGKSLEIESWYNHPEWFEIGFQDETLKEAAFFEKAFQRWCEFPVRRLLEPACGSGRLVVEMASRGYDVTGFDLSQPSLDYLQRKLKRRRLRAQALRGNMSRFTFPDKFDAAFCMINSFRHLTSEEAARNHLQCVAQSLHRGGLYFLGMHLERPGVEPMCAERWVGQRGRTHVTTTLRVIETLPKKRLELLRISVLVRRLAIGDSLIRRPKKGVTSASRTHAAPRGSIGAAQDGAVSSKLAGTIVARVRDEFYYRLYTATQIRRSIASVPQLEVVEVFDHRYDINKPQKLSNETTGVLFVLRRR